MKRNQSHWQYQLSSEFETGFPPDDRRWGEENGPEHSKDALTKHGGRVRVPTAQIPESGKPGGDSEPRDLRVRCAPA
jgi:hypothetical protein